jgi:hypothetical protein
MTTTEILTLLAWWLVLSKLYQLLELLLLHRT